MIHPRRVGHPFAEFHLVWAFSLRFEVIRARHGPNNLVLDGLGEWNCRICWSSHQPFREEIFNELVDRPGRRSSGERELCFFSRGSCRRGFFEPSPQLCRLDRCGVCRS